MIKFTKLQLQEILNKIIIELEVCSNFDCVFNLNYNEDGSYFSKISSVYKLSIGCSFLNHYQDNHFILDKDIVDVIVNIYHKYQHALRNYEMYHNFQQGNKEVYMSSFTSTYFPYYYHKKYKMSPSELDAELNGIIENPLKGSPNEYWDTQYSICMQSCSLKNFIQNLILKVLL